MSFTGSPEVGRQIAAACGRNLVPVKLELGGKGAAVVFDDVAFEQTVENLVRRSPSTPARSAATPRGGSSSGRSTSVRRGRQPTGSAGADRPPAGPGHADGAGGQRETADAGAGLSPPRPRKGAEMLLKAARPSCRAGTASTSSRPSWPARWTTWRPARKSSARWPTWPRSTTRRRPSAWPTRPTTAWPTASGQRPGSRRRVAEAMAAGNSWINAHNIFPHGVALRRHQPQRPGRRRALRRDPGRLLAASLRRSAVGIDIDNAATGSETGPAINPRKQGMRVALALVAATLLVNVGYAAGTGNEAAALGAWLDAAMLHPAPATAQPTPFAEHATLGNTLPFSFVYDGKPSPQLLGRWKRSVGPIKTSGGKSRQRHHLRRSADGPRGCLRIDAVRGLSGGRVALATHQPRQR